MSTRVDLDRVARALNVRSDAGIVEEVAAICARLDDTRTALAELRVDVTDVSEPAVEALVVALDRVIDAGALLGAVVDAAEAHVRGES
ncbi:MAG: hypothetical protein ACRCYU_02555 [Nocardioides sp.]